MLLIPAIDLLQGRCVRLYQGDFSTATRYGLPAHELAQRYRALGASWLHVVDLDGAKHGVLANRSIVSELAALGSLKLQVGGGIRSALEIEELLRVGVARVVIGSAALERPQEVVRWLEQFGAERMCLAFDVRFDASGEPRVRTRGWVGGGAVSLWQALDPFRGGALRHVLCTDIERDGALCGPSLALYRQAVRRFPELAWQASGGVRHVLDLRELAQSGVEAAVSGKALLEGRLSPEELRSFLPNASFPASTCATGRS